MEKFKNSVGLIFLVILLLTFIIGGYFAMKYFTTHTPEVKKDASKSEKVVDLRIDKKKDYIYYENEDEVLESEEISFLDAVINIKGLEDVNKLLKSEEDALRKTIKYSKDVELPEGTTENEAGIYSLEYRDYKDYTYSKYLSLVITDYSYNLVNGSIPTHFVSYVVNTETGEQITGDNLLTMFNTNMDAIKSKINQRLQDTQTLNSDINITETMNNLGTFALYIDKVGKLEVSFIVKTNETSYNDSVVVSE